MTTNPANESFSAQRWAVSQLRFERLIRRLEDPDDVVTRPGRPAAIFEAVPAQ